MISKISEKLIKYLSVIKNYSIEKQKYDKTEFLFIHKLLKKYINE